VKWVKGISAEALYTYLISRRTAVAVYTLQLC